MAISRHNKTLNTFKGTAMNPHSLSHCHERLARPGNAVRKERPNGLNLLIRDGCTFGMLPDKSDYSIGTKHTNARFAGGDQSNEDVTGE